MREAAEADVSSDVTGKSSLLLRFTEDDFLPDEETTATIGVDFKVAFIEMNGRRYKLSIWVGNYPLSEALWPYTRASAPLPTPTMDGDDLQDTAGQERFRTLTSSYYRGAQAVLLGAHAFEQRAWCTRAETTVYDITSRVTFDELIKWSREIDTYCPDGVVRVILGNKLDKVGTLLNIRLRVTHAVGAVPPNISRRGERLCCSDERCLYG